MKKQLLLLGIAITMGIGCIGCGGNKDVANNDKVAETTTEELSTVDNEVTEVKPATKKTTEEKTTEATTEKVSENNKSEKSDKKKSDSKSNKKSGATTQAAATQPANESKPVVTTTNSSTSNNTSANNTSQTTQASSKPQTTECQHNWVHVDAVMGERCVKPAVTAHWYCRDCQQYYINHTDDPHYGISGNGSEASYDLEPAVFETYEVSPAYDYCSKCGIRK